MNESENRIKRWQFRKNKKLEKRRQRRQLKAEKTQTETITNPTEEEKQRYEEQKALWEEREEKFKLIELTKRKAKEKEEQAKLEAQKRWHDTLLNLPTMPPQFTPNSKHKSTFKTFVQSNLEPILVDKKTYRERFLEMKQAKNQK